MKQLYLIRHAKSSWSDAILSDFDRPLNKRGLKDAPKMGQYMLQQNIKLDLIISSPANGAYTTASIIAHEISYPKAKIKKIDNLYLADIATFFSTVKGTPNDINNLALFSHNGGISDFANILTSAKIDNMPTCSIFAIQFNINSWDDIDKNIGEFMFFKAPKQL